MMNKEIKTDWVAALRSGEYQQVQRMLCSVEDGEVTGHCCLGVLTDLYLKDKDLTLDELRTSEGGSEYLTRSVREWSGLSESDPGVLVEPVGDEHIIRMNLSELNDGGTWVGRMNFKQIAYLIEAQL